MSGITAQSATKTLAAGDTVVDNSVSGYVSKEQISLGLTGTPTTALWSISKPNTSGSSCQIDDDTSLRPKFSPNAEGIYVISCLVDGITTYVLRIYVVSVAVTTSISAIHFLPCSNAQIPTPRSGVTQFFSSDSGVMSQKLTDGTVIPI